MLSSSQSSNVKKWLAILWLVTIVVTLGQGMVAAPVVNKCCDVGHHLNKWLNACETVAVSGGMGGAGGAGGAVARPGEEEWFLGSTLAALQQLAGAGAAVRAGRRPCSVEDALFLGAKSADSFRALPDGRLQLLGAWRSDARGRGRRAHEVTLPADEWCGDLVGSGRVVLLACPCTRVTCVNRCCNSNFVFLEEKGRGGVINVRCAKMTDAPPAEALTFYDEREPLGGGGKEQEEGVSYVELFAHSLTCKPDRYKQYLLHSDTDPEEVAKGSAEGASRKWWLQRNGSALLHKYGHGRAVARRHVCLVDVLQQDGRLRPDVYFCAPLGTGLLPDASDVYFAAVLVCGSAFLVLTLLVHALVPELRRSAHAKALMCHCVALTVAVLVVSATHIWRTLREPYCTASALVVQYFFLSTFFWLNVMCLDVAMTFGALRWRRRAAAAVAGTGPREQSKRFVLYSLYAWGSPAVISALTIFLQYSPSVPPDFVLLPNIGARKCWFDTKLTTFVYYYGPMALLIVANCVLFALTIARIRGLHRSTSILRRPPSARVGDASAKPSKPSQATATEGAAKKASERHMILVFTKLFCLMGVTWLTEVVAWLVAEQGTSLWFVTDALNMLRGMLIFVFFCCKRAAWRPLRARWAAWRRRTAEGGGRGVGSGGRGGGGGGEGAGAGGSSARPSDAGSSARPSDAGSSARPSDAGSASTARTSLSGLEMREVACAPTKD